MLNLGIAEFLEKVVKVLGIFFLHLTFVNVKFENCWIFGESCESFRYSFYKTWLY